MITPTLTMDLIKRPNGYKFWRVYIIWQNGDNKPPIYHCGEHSDPAIAIMFAANRLATWQNEEIITKTYD